jgi:hypothetical protein
MRRLFAYGLLVFAVYYMFTGGVGILNDIGKSNIASLVSGVTQGEMDATIVKHYTTTILENTPAINPDAINKTISDLNEDGREDIIAVVESSSTCGTGGCILSIFLRDDHGELNAIPFNMAVKNIKVLESMTRGMHDLRVNNDETSRMVWDGTTYMFEQI